MIRTDKILLKHGSGGKSMATLVHEIFMRYFDNSILSEKTDAARIDVPNQKLVFTTDAFVVDPIFFPGGDIGKLAVCGTVNDLAVTGAKPLFLSASFIIEEGFPVTDLIRVVKSMAKASAEAGVKIVAGDTKVVHKGKCDKIFISTSGIGTIGLKQIPIATGKRMKPGDHIIVTGYVGDHGTAVMAAREGFNMQIRVRSDCAPLNHMIQRLLKAGIDITFMRDATRGGVATVLNEAVEGKSLGISVNEQKVPCRSAVRGFCELLGFDPLYIANEGKAVIIVRPGDALKALHVLRKDQYGRLAADIGTITRNNPGRVILQTQTGSQRYLDMLSGDQLPRIC
ncbi:MAG: hydrogenase expression/formation protein HypE [Bacteroidetes bacterium]|nr:hydrogenase expression/formation protein HypE [Bacteroidota bacterium]